MLMTMMIYVVLMLMIFVVTVNQECTNFSKTSRTISKIIDAARVTSSKYRTENPQILGDTVPNLVAVTPGICAPLL